MCVNRVVTDVATTINATTTTTTASTTATTTATITFLKLWMTKGRKMIWTEKVTRMLEIKSKTFRETEE
jgi:hypothetical protein